MAKKEQHIYQFKITLQGSNPPIWRRIQVPEECTFFYFHVVIQDAMGWEGYHSHSFKMTDPKTGKTIILSDESDEEDFEEDDFFKQFGMNFDSRFPMVRDENDAHLSSYFSLLNKKATYEYDFGDGWRHKIILEKVLPFESGIMYPRCLAGKRACPPEDCGGIWGYEELLEIIKNPSSDEYEERLEWLGDDFDPESFDPTSVQFSYHKKRLKMIT
jgi:hypothetical protein